MGEASAERFRILDRIAEGGMAVVDRAVAVGPDGFERELVIKRILPRYCRDERFARMLIDEARIASQLNHPNIVQIYELGKLDDQYFLAMEYVPGADLARLRSDLQAKGEAFPLALALFVGIETCRALDYAHRKRGPDGASLHIVHRDVSPQNLLISFEGAVKLADFGIARAAERKEKTLQGMVKGKVAYMSPEQLRGESLDGRSDLYAAALVLHLLLAGEHPYAEANETRTIEAALARRWPKLAEAAPELPRALCELVDKGTALRREDRLASAGELAEALEHLVFEHRLRATAGELAALMRSLYGEAATAGSPARRTVDLDGVMSSEIRRLVGGGGEVPTFTLTAPAVEARGRRGTGTQMMFKVSLPAPGPALAQDAQKEQQERGGSDTAPPESDQPAPRRSRRGLAIALAVAFALVVGVGAYAFWLRPSHDPEPRRAGVAAATVASAATTDAGGQKGRLHDDTGVQQRLASETAAADVQDAARTEPRQADADAATAHEYPARGVVQKRPRPRASPSRTGWLRVTTHPHWAEVYVDGRRRGTTPLLVEVPAGRRRLRLVNSQLGRSERRTVLVPEGAPRSAPAAVRVSEF